MDEPWPCAVEADRAYARWCAVYGAALVASALRHAELGKGTGAVTDYAEWANDASNMADAAEIGYAAGISTIAHDAG